MLLNCGTCLASEICEHMISSDSCLRFNKLLEEKFNPTYSNSTPISCKDTCTKQQMCTHCSRFTRKDYYTNKKRTYTNSGAL